MDWILHHPIEFVSGCIIMGGVIVFLYAAITNPGGPSNVPAKPDPYNGMDERDVAFHRERGTLNDALIIHTAQVKGETGGREQLAKTPVTYKPEGDYATWRYAKYLKDSHPEMLRNPKAVEASDAERHKTQDGGKGYTWNERAGRYVRDK